MLLTLIPGEICSLSSWTQRTSWVGNLSGKIPATDYLGRAILLLKWRLFWHFPVQLKLLLKLHRLNKKYSYMVLKKIIPSVDPSFTNTYIWV